MTFNILAKAAVEAVLSGSENLKLGQYFEIDLYKTAEGVETRITQNNEPITITIAVPEALRGREFVLIRVHDGNLDFGKLKYISSAGLRVLLAAQKIINKQDKMVIRNVNDVISEVFEVTGFSDILTIE